MPDRRSLLLAACLLAPFLPARAEPPVVVETLVHAPVADVWKA